MKIDSLYGLIETPDWPEDLIVRSLRQLGEWCAVETALAATLIEPGATVWDAGAFLGTFSLGTALHSKPGRVFAIEANPAVIAALEQNLQLLSCPAQPIACGLAAKPGWLIPTAEQASNHGATTYSFVDGDQNDARAIPCRTLVDLRGEHGDYAFLKLDLEGMELDALRGDFPFIKAHKPVIWTECNEDRGSLQLLGALKYLEYDVLYVAFPAFRKANFRDSPDLIYPMAYEAALVAAPAEMLDRLSSNVADLVQEDVLCRSVSTTFDLRRALFDTPRWSRPEWAAMSRAELIARLGRLEQKTRLDKFLIDSPAKSETKPD